MSAATIGGMGDAMARVAAIQAQITSVVGASPGSAAVPVFQLPPTPAPAPPPEPEPAPAPAPPAPAEAARTEPTPAPATPAPVAAPVAPAAPAPTATGRSDGANGAGGPTATPGPWAAKLSEQGQRWAPAIQAAADEAGIDASLLAALVRHESNFDPSVTSHAGAIGLAQLMPGTAAGLGVDPHDPHENLAGGARYLRSQLDRFGTPELALAAYNAGPNRVAQAGGIPRIAETTAYVQRVISTWEQLR